MRLNAVTNSEMCEPTSPSRLLSLCLDRMGCDKENKWLMASVYWENKLTVAVCILVHKADLQKLMGIRLYTLFPQQDGHFSWKSLSQNCNFCTYTSLLANYFSDLMTTQVVCNGNVYLWSISSLTFILLLPWSVLLPADFSVRDVCLC